MRFYARAARAATLSVVIAGAVAIPAHAADTTSYTLDGTASTKAAVLELGDRALCDATNAASGGVVSCTTVSSTPKPGASASRTAGSTGARDFTDCSNGSRTYMYPNSSFGGTAYFISGGTGVGAWQNLVSGIDNATSSFWARAGTTTSRWHDYANGGGAYYGNGTSCRAVENLQNASMGDGGTANDRFSSYASW